MADAYDLLPYTEHAYAESRPDNLRVIARLAGWSSAQTFASTAPRILELGCGRGGNLLPLASVWPDATFVGIDRSVTQIRDASRIAEAAALRNVSFVTADFTEGSHCSESFDFVICHGVYSWIPAASRPALLARIRGALTADGVALVSFNTLPGWYRKLAARDWMRFAARSSFAEGPREAVRWLAGVASPERGFYRADLEAVHARLLSTDAAYLTHEYLAEEHHPVHVTTLVAEAADAGLTYLGDALPSEVTLELASDAVLSRAATLDVAGALQLGDFVRDTAFRRALVVRTDTADARRFRAPIRLDGAALAELRIASRLHAVAEASAPGIDTFDGAGERVQVSGLARNALHALADAAPRSIPCRDLATAIGTTVEPLAEELYALWLATPGIDLHTCEPEFTTTVSDRPRTSAVARWHAIEGGPVTNVWHQEVVLPDPIVRFLLGRLDGKTSLRELTRSVASRSEGRVSEEGARGIVDASLASLARAALLLK
jgi:SAM-dependent methyltransferase